MTQRVILAIDEGTTNSKAALFSEDGSILATGSSPVPIRHPKSGWVDQRADEIWDATVAAISACLEEGPEVEIAAIGISNQRESILIWDRATGAPLGPVVTWQCRRSAAACERLKAEGKEPDVIARTGLPLDPLFPATKVGWLLENHAKDRDPAEICVGTVDSWLIWKFTGGAAHAGDASNAARTQLFNIGDGQWDAELCALFGVAREMLPEVYDSSHVFGTTASVEGLPDGIPVASAIGDSHAALFGHGAHLPGDGKVTFGTGSSVMTTVPSFVVPPKGITTTIAWQYDGTITYAFEGNILVSASILPWTAELLGVGSVDELMALSETVDTTLGVSLVPAHVGLGSPHWDSEARGLISGLNFSAGPAHIARAAVESIAFQVNDVFEIVRANAGQDIGRLFVDGGPSRNMGLMQMVADIIDHSVITSESADASARGAAYLAGLAVGFWQDLETVAGLEPHDTALEPRMDPAARAAAVGLWTTAIKRSTMRP
ncbi:FGGY family carbohydrate kinase [Aliiruegeria lutimaris]|uniref:ATP:glycerol 3-phosphotransferase n=1 Tax=Aliiruegeria lutimaris TaxID=571298 RepID=A0A1G9L7Y5_9RHOB|nr:FGGY-family carbohydrate kinase [Aliiruegeria lutimaris]SDL57853.1 glycerol kinase [Aliiruegeria lutimaris]